MRTWRTSTAAMLLAALFTSVLAAAPPAASNGIARAADAAPPDKRVYIVAESVGLSARPALLQAFPPDWQVTVDGTPALFVEQLETKHVRPRMAATPSVFGDVAIVAGGHNYPYWDPARFDRSIDSMVATLRATGAKQIYWVTLREVQQQHVTAAAWQQAQTFVWYLPLVNEHLRAATLRHPDLTLIDWAAIANRPGITYDTIHLNAFGASLYSSLVASTVLDTIRRPAAGTVTEVAVGAVAPAAAGGAAVAVNIAAVRGRAPGYVTAFPCGTEPPLVANVSFDADVATSSAAIVPIAGDGRICLRANQAVHAVVDVAGVLPAGAGVRTVTPARLADTREGGGARLPPRTALRVAAAGSHGIASDARAIAVTVTVTDAAAAGFVAVAPCGSGPTGTANVNFAAAATVSNLVIVAPGERGDVCVTSNVDTHVVVDLFAVFDAAAEVGTTGGGVRLVDTREPPAVRLTPGGELRVRVAGEHGVPRDASAVVLNLTGVAPGADGYLTAYPCDAGRPLAANVNLTAGEDRGNLVIVAPDPAGDVCVSSYAESDVVVDLFGWFGGAFDGGAPVRALDTRG